MSDEREERTEERTGETHEETHEETHDETHDETREKKKPDRHLIIIGLGIFIAIILIILSLTAGFGAGYLLTYTEVQALQNHAIQQEQELKNTQESLKAANQELSQMKKVMENAEIMQARNTVYRDILKRWKLPIPHDQDLDSFVIGVYFCETWCEWYKDKLPIVKRAYEESNCPSCNKPKPKVVVIKQKCKDCEPPPPPPPPPKKVEKIKDIIGPTATCPKTKP